MKRNFRQHSRTVIQLDIQLGYASDPDIIIKIHDISDGGIFILTHSPKHYEIGKHIYLKFKNPSHTSIIDEKKAIIVRHDNNGFGAMFVY